MGASPGFIHGQTPSAEEWDAIFAGKADDPGSPYSYQQPLTGATLTATQHLGAFIIDPAGAIATLTVVAPTLAIDGQVFEISTTQTITALTITPAFGQTVKGGGPMMLTANGGVSWRYRSADDTWYRRY